MCEWLWFGILQSYAIKRLMRLTSMQLAEVVCIGYRYQLSVHAWPIHRYWHRLQKCHIGQSILFNI